LRKAVGSWILGCDICQEVCPYNQAPAETVWKEFQPQAGVGHFLNLFDILKITSKNEFLSLFAHTALERPKRTGLIRNALVVIGNRLPEGGAQAIYEFLKSEQDLMLVEHGLWALSRYEDSRKLLKRLYESLQCPSNNLVLQYLDSDR